MKRLVKMLLVFVGSSVGVIIPDTVSRVAKDAFEQTLKDLTAMRSQVGGL